MEGAKGLYDIGPSLRSYYESCVTENSCRCGFQASGRSMAISILSFLANSAQILFFLAGLFYLFLSFRGFWSIAPPPRARKKLRFALLLPAYNEEKVIRFSVESLLGIKYPRELFEVFVVADHCTDDTARIARGLGARVLEHSFAASKPGKGRALKWAVSEILKTGGYDVFCYFDADSLAHPDFLSVMNDHLNAGEEAVQGRQLSKNTEAWLPRILAAGHIVSNKLFQAPKYACGLSATLHGKGMCFSKRVTEDFPWDETCLTEDIEMQMRLIRNGVRVTWAENAVVFNEEPVSIRQYVRRNVRWTRGSMDVAGRHLKGLFERTVRFLDFNAFEGTLYCGGVYKLGVVVGLTAALLCVTRDSFVFLFWFYDRLPGSGPALKLMSLSPLALYPAAALVMAKAGPQMFLAYFLQPVLNILRLPIFVAGLFRGDAFWDRTEHSSGVAITDLV